MRLVTPEGTTFSSRVITTIVNGIPVVSEGRLTGRRAPEMLRFQQVKQLQA
ncbi:MAG: hypothetical protein MZV63_52290 [Marinilabiliales bacterium]|nr:hypothetical protein [Marinilabiliales bacterium]